MNSASESNRMADKLTGCLLDAYWVGDEALAISLYCALAAKGDFVCGVRLAVFFRVIPTLPAQ